MLLSLPVVLMSQMSRCCIEKEIVVQSASGHISEVPLHAGMWVEWETARDVITMMDGSLWKNTKSTDGLIHYRYIGTSGRPQSYTKLTEAIFNKDFTKMKIHYTFDPMGMFVNMVGIYTCLSNGK